MNKKALQVFGDSRGLRGRLAVYLQKPSAVEGYFKAAVKFFNKGDKKSIAFVPTWSWWGFFFELLFLGYRKLYVPFVFLFILIALFSFIIPQTVPGVGLIYDCCVFFIFVATHIFSGLFAKYFVIQDFLIKLERSERNNDESILETGNNLLLACIFFIFELYWVILGVLVGIRFFYVFLLK